MDVTPAPAVAIPEAAAIVTSVQSTPLDDTDDAIPGTTTIVGYQVGEAMVVAGRVVDATAHPVTLPLFMGATGNGGDDEPLDTSGYLALWTPEKGKPDTGSWATYYRSPALSTRMTMNFSPLPEVEAEFATWVQDTVRLETAVVLGEGVTGRMSSFPGNAIVMALVLGQEYSDVANGVLSWQLNPAIQIAVNPDGTVLALYGENVIAEHQVFTPVTARPLVIAAAVIDRSLVMVIVDGATTVARAKLPSQAQFALEAPLLIGQITLNNEVFYSDMALLHLGMARVRYEREIVALATDMAAEYAVVLTP